MKKTMPSTGEKNPYVAKGLRKYGPGRALHATGKWRFLPKNNSDVKPKKKALVEKDQSIQKWYPTEDIKPRNQRKAAMKAIRRAEGKVYNSRKSIAKLKRGLVPGKVVIILAGKYQGKRAVFLKQLKESGMLLVTGPFGVNGVPLRRIPQCYVIVTSTKLPIDAITLPKEVEDEKEFFGKKTTNKENKERKKLRRKVTEDKFFKQGQRLAIDPEWLAKRKEIQKQVDESIIKAVKATPLMRQYLRELFGLKSGEAPHRMLF